MIMMQKQKLTSSLMSAFLDRLHVRDYGEGLLVSLPFKYSDGDSVVVCVLPYGDLLRVTDRSEAVDRLEEAGVVLDRSNRPSELASLMRRAARLNGIGADEDEISTVVASDTLSEAVLTVGEVAQEIEHLRWTAKEATPLRYSDVVISEMQAIAARFKWKAQPNATIHLTTGQDRRLTARVQAGENTGYVQALAATDRGSAVEHAYFLFSHLDADRRQKIAVFDMRRGKWSPNELEAVGQKSTVVRYREPADIEQALVELASTPLS